MIQLLNVSFSFRTLYLVNPHFRTLSKQTQYTNLVFSVLSLTNGVVFSFQSSMTILSLANNRQRQTLVLTTVGLEISLLRSDNI